MASLFISYSRKDKEAARKLTEAFKGQDLDFWIDWEGIEPTVDWWRAIEKGIEDADTFVFLISPDSIASKVCGWEIEHAVKNGKRLIPVVVRDVRAAESPAALRPLNWIFLREAKEFDAALIQLIKAIQTDFAWAQVHRQLQVKALEWEASTRKNEFLLRGAELQDAEQQLATNSSKAPRPTDLQRDYVLKSHQESDRQRRLFTVTALILAIVMGGLGLFGLDRARLADANAVKEQAASTLAVSNEQTAVANEAEARRQANIALSRQLTAKSQTELLANRDRRLSLLFAIEAIRVARDTEDFQNLAAEQALRDALHQTGGEVIVNPIRENVYTARFGAMGTSVAKALSPAGDWVAIGYEDRTIHVWDLGHPEEAPEILKPVSDISIDKLTSSPNGRFLLLLNTEGPVEIWDVKHLSEGSRFLEIDLPSEPWFFGLPLVFSANDQWLASTAGGDYLVFDLFDSDVEPLRIPGGEVLLPPLALSPKGDRLFLLDSKDSANKLWNPRTPEHELGTLAEGISSCTKALFSSDGAWLAADCRGIIKVWSMQDTSIPFLEHTPPRGDSYTLGSLSPDGTRLAITSKQGILSVLDLTSGGSTSSFIYAAENMPLTDCQFSGDNSRVACRDTNRDILVWDLSAANTFPITLSGLGGFDTSAEFMAFAPDNLHLVSVSDDGVTRMWDLRKPHSDALGAALRSDDFSFSSDGHWLVANALDWSSPSNVLLDLQDFSGAPVALPSGNASLFLSPDGKQLVSVSGTEGRIQTWQTQSIAGGDLKPTSRSLPGIMQGNVIDHRWLISQLKDRTLQMWDLFNPNAKPVALPADLLEQMQFSISSNGHSLAVISKGDTVQVWELGPANAAPRQVQEVARPTALKLSPNGNWLALVDEGLVKVWDLRKSTQGPVHVIEPDKGGTWIMRGPATLTFSADENWLVLDQTIGMKLLDLQTPGAQPVEIRGLVDRIALSPDGQWLAAGGMVPEAGTQVRLWNLQDLRSGPIVLQREKSSIHSLGFSPNGKWLAAGFYSPAYNTVEAWPLDIDELINSACESMGSNFSRLQWEENFPLEMEYRPTCPQWPEGRDKILVIPAG